MVEQYQARIEEIIETMIRESKTDEGWEEISTNNDITVWTKNQEDNQTKSGRAKGRIKTSVLDVFSVLQGVEIYHEVDPLYQNGRVVREYDKNHVILHAVYSTGVILVSNRDFCYLEARRHYEDGTKILACFSIEDPECPEIEGNVRGHIFYSGWVLKPFNPPKEEIQKDGSSEWCDASFLGQIDLKGWIPTFVINQCTSEIGNSIENIRKYYERKEQEKLGLQPKTNQEEEETEETSWGGFFG